MSFWGRARDAAIGTALGGPVGGIVGGLYGGQIRQGVKGLGNPMDWGKEQADPSKAVLQDGDWMRDYLKGRMGGIDGRQAPQVNGARIATGQQAQWRGREMTLADQLAGVASGQQAGAGELAVRRAQRQGVAQQLAGAAMQRGANAGIAGRAAARGIGSINVNAAGQASQAATADQAQARGLLAGVLGQGRSADIGLATNQAGLDQQAGLANQAARLQQMGMNDAAIAQTLGQMYGISAAEMQARLAQEAAYMGQEGILPSLLQVGGAMGQAAVMASDARLKTDIDDGREKVDEFLDALDPVTFEYRNPGVDGEGSFAGILAQDAEQSEIGREFVMDTPRGKMLDNRKVISALLASVARLNQRIRELEAK